MGVVAYGSYDFPGIVIYLQLVFLFFVLGPI